MRLNPEKIRADFPILATQMRGKPLTYLDSGATSQKPQVVIDRLREHFFTRNANVHRGAYELSEIATQDYEGVREDVCRFLGTKNPREVIFTRGTTESINLVASSWARHNIRAGDSIIVTRMEHHSNFVPWQVIAKEKGAHFKIVELGADYRLDMNSLKAALQDRPKLIAITHMSNVLGTINPIQEIARLAHQAGAKIMVDAAQSVVHLPLNPDEIDFLAFSAHKMCGPTGVGVLWAKEELLENMAPYQFGGDMISEVRDDRTDWNELPWKFEAGTPDIGGAIAMGAAIRYLEGIGMDSIHEYESQLGTYALERLQKLPFLRLIGPSTMKDRGTAFSFVFDGVHPHDVATVLDSQGIAVRAGHHCAQPLMTKLGISATTRASLAFYNTHQEIDRLVEGFLEVKRFFKK